MDIVLDIETENTGYDVMNHNKRLISVQMLNGNTRQLFYDGSQNNSLNNARSEILSQIENGSNFVGFNIRNFDVPFLKRFLEVEIPSQQILDISEMNELSKIRNEIGKRYPRLLEICEHLGIDCSHKTMMDDYAMKFRDLPNVLELAKQGAKEWASKKGWSYDFSLKLAVDKITGGMAILESFNEFVRKGGSHEALFYNYAIGDILAENNLFQKLKEMS